MMFCEVLHAGFPPTPTGRDTLNEGCFLNEVV
jgi:hypothetical protein